MISFARSAFFCSSSEFTTALLLNARKIRADDFSPEPISVFVEMKPVFHKELLAGLSLFIEHRIKNIDVINLFVFPRKIANQLISFSHLIDQIRPARTRLHRNKSDPGLRKLFVNDRNKFFKIFCHLFGRKTSL